MLRKSRLGRESSSQSQCSSTTPLLTLTPQNSQEEWLSSSSDMEDDRPTVTFTQPSNSDDSDNDDDQWESILQLEAPLTTLPPTYSLQHRLLYWTLVSFPTLLRDFVRLMIFVLLLAPAFIRFFLYYLTCDRVVVKYGESVRHSMDIYGANTHLNLNESSVNHTSSASSHQKKPVLIFFTGGAWVIGYKMWGAFLAKVFAALGVLVVVPDYRNYPLCTVPAMVSDTEQAIQWVMDHIHNYHGDSTRIMLAGQSAGGHLAATVLLKKALALLHNDTHMSVDDDSTTSFKPTDLAGFCCISAPSDVQAMSTNFQKHGLDQSFVQSLFGVNPNPNPHSTTTSLNVSMDDYDPQRLVEQLQKELQLFDNSNVDADADVNLEVDQDLLLPPTSSASPYHTDTSSSSHPTINQLLPPMSIFHGTADQTVPYEVSERFAYSLQECGVQAEYIQYQGWSHTDPILEAIMMADHRFHADLYQRLYKWTMMTNQNKTTATHVNLQEQQHPLLARSTLDDSIPECQPLCPTPLVKAARFVNPF